MLNNLTNKWNNFTKGFKLFFLQGNLFKIAMAFLMGQLFSKVIASLSSDILMPPLNLLFDTKMPIQDLKINLRDKIYINYGLFLQNLLEFFIVSLFFYICIYCIMKKTVTNPLSSISNVQITEHQMEIIKNLAMSHQQQNAILEEIKRLLQDQQKYKKD